MSEDISKTVAFIADLVGCRPAVGIILGTGLGGLTHEITIQNKIPYRSIPHFPVSAVEGHEGILISGSLGHTEVIVLQGRTHFYEGNGMASVVFPVRVLKMLGVKLLILSNASGGINPSFRIGDIMIVTDHINLMPTNPLIGENQMTVNDRPANMANLYDHEIIQEILTVANRHDIEVRTGILAAVSGPCFETPAEYRFIRTIGADAVGMSIIPEIIAARQLDMTCLAISVITDLCIDGKLKEVTHHNVLKAASDAEPKMTLLIKKLLEGFKKH